MLDSSFSDGGCPAPDGGPDRDRDTFGAVLVVIDVVDRSWQRVEALLSFCIAVAFVLCVELVCCNNRHGRSSSAHCSCCCDGDGCVRCGHCCHSSCDNCGARAACFVHDCDCNCNVTDCYSADSRD